MTDTIKSRGQRIASDVAALLRARNPLIWITTREESRVEALLIEAAASAAYEVVFWDVVQGATTPAGKPSTIGGAPDPMETLATIRQNAENGTRRNVWIMRDLPIWLDGLAGASCLRSLRNLARFLPSVPRDRAQAIIVLSPSANIPPELSSIATAIDWALPDRAEIGAILDAAIQALPDDMRESAAPNGARDAAIDAAIGLTGDEAAACYAKSLVSTRRIDPAIVASEKKRVIAREKVLEWYDPLSGGLDAVGGLENLKAWLIARKAAYTKEARAYGLPAPRGVLLVGVPGCGKSLTAKAIATNWGVPLLRVDLGGLKSKFVGESEATLRRALRTIEAVGRCVVWLDEIEKALAGATQGAADGGVSSDALGTLLTWLQERQGESFVVATSNDVSSLPPELLRKGRFDELWFVDLPTRVERAAIVSAALKVHGRTGDESLLSAVAAATEGFTGAEIAALVPDALFAAFADGAREIRADDLVNAAKTVVPLSKTASEKIRALREWATARARPASQSENAATDGARRLDIA
jgi:AAA+ superfamily predicted ATPase